MAETGTPRPANAETAMPNDKQTSPPPPDPFGLTGTDFDAFARNMAQAVEEGGRVTAAYLKPLETGNAAQATIADGYVEIRNGEAWLVNITIRPYAYATAFAHESGRRRKLLLHKHEIKKLDSKFSQKGFALIPLALYLKNGRVKLEFAPIGLPN